MKIFSIPKKDEEYSEINYPLGGLRLKPRAVSPNQSGVAHWVELHSIISV
jgi:hypothetical protein